MAPHAYRTRLITSGFNASPAPTSSRGGLANRDRSAWISIRHTVGGAQNDVTWWASITCINASALKRA